MTALCRRVDEVVDEMAAGLAVAPDLEGHVASCAPCQARLGLARRIDRVLAAWPEVTPPPQFAATVAAATRREAWRHEVVVDWGFNIAVAASLLVILAGAASLMWMVGASAEVITTSRVTAGALNDLLQRARGQAAIVGTATVLLATTVGAWWWAEEGGRW